MTTRTTYAQYVKATYPVGYAFRPRECKLIEAAQSGLSEEWALRNAVSQANDNDLIVLAPGTLTLTQQLVINKPLRFKGSSASGVGGTTLTGAFAGSLISIELAAHSSAAEVSFEDIVFTQGSDDVDVIDVNNTNAAAALTVRFDRCSINVFDSAANGWAVDVAHATAGQAINLLVSGRGTEIVNAINFTVKNASDVLELHRVKLQDAGKATAIVTSTDAVAGQIRLFDCQVPHELGVSGGDAAQLLISVGNYSLTGTTYAAADTNDFIGSQTETIVP